MSADTANRSDERHSPILEVEGLSKSFGEIKALSDVDLAIEQGEVHTIIGPNGAGKTTLFNLITGSLRPTAGSVQFKDQDVTKKSLDARTRFGLTRVFQSAEIFPDLTVKENLRLAAQSREQSLNPLSRQKEGHERDAEEMLNAIDLGVSATTNSEDLSHGDKKRLEIGMSLATKPNCLLLDEPTSGVSEKDSQRIIDQLIEMTADITVILIEHDIDIVMGVSDRITALESGQRIAQGSPEEIEDNEEVQRAYLGGYV
ncbi:branched-chain amino acid transport ATP-binding protein LivG [Halarchaeum acidiphilum MH1-52-1]|uniref:Probable branched-chain amino acid transport ATP-binding protein LivG n=1 Tax=Halarchaeum acidiphilum MH1-52-1 TaxID=1261545 RepID=U2YDR9_9EURY|nr:ABC transporter ATP-binding protein [Halarchaeum acidiphilum]GAD51816.1 branched-chain amino acid transport ATP-binding protein LivG [Halarchaeum acidiphilum MH1-52-1]